MNWYKKAKINKESDIKEILKSFGITSILGLSLLLGLNINETREYLNNNPEKVIEELYNRQNRLIQTPSQEDFKQDYPQTQPMIDKSYDISLDEASDDTTVDKEDSRSIKQSDWIQDAKESIAFHEGWENSVYICTEGYPTIGIGFNLKRPNAKSMIERVGANYQDVLNGQPLSDNQIKQLFEFDLQTAINDAKQFLPNFNEQPSEVKSIIVDMAFNLGYPRLSSFENMKEALLNKDYQTAANEMIDSRWYNQVGRRSKNLVNKMRSVN